jgi:TATA-binding protein-associated factor
LPKDWISYAFLCLIFQNLLVEERNNIRTATLDLWRTCLDILSQTENATQATISSPLISDWFALMLQPWGVPFDTTLFYHHALHQTNKGDKGERHNVDKAMLAQDVALVTSEVIWEARIAAARAMGLLISMWPSAEEAVSINLLPSFEVLIVVKGHYFPRNPSPLSLVYKCVAEGARCNNN